MIIHWSLTNQYLKPYQGIFLAGAEHILAHAEQDRG